MIDDDAPLVVPVELLPLLAERAEKLVELLDGIPDDEPISEARFVRLCAEAVRLVPAP
jgi:hypothetical protein